MYPSINATDFTRRLFEKCEFAEVSAGRTVEQRLLGLRKHQNFVQRFISPATPYESLLLVHVTGSGKTWSMASIIDNFKFVKKRAIVLLQGLTAIGAFRANMEEWFRSYYGVEENTETELKKYMDAYIDIRRYITFARHISEMSDTDIVKEFSNRVLIIDEAHHLSIKTNARDKQTYNQLLRLLGLVRNCRIIVSTATPIVDVHTEIYSLVNLILPVSERLTSAASQTLDNLRRVVTGRVSYFMQDMGEKPRVIEVGTEIRDSDQRLIFVRMQSRQLQAYEKLPQANNEMYMDVRYTSLLVLPKEINDSGNYECIHHRSNIPDNYLRIVHTSSKGVPSSQFADDDVRDLIFQMFCNRSDSPDRSNIGLYALSCKLGYLIDELEKFDRRQEKCFLFCREVQAFGIKSISAILNAIGFEFYDGSTPIGEMSIKPRFTMITGEGSSTTKRTESHMARLHTFNDDRNKHGIYLRILIVSDVGSESLTLKCVRQVHVLTPFWNNNKTVQVIARAVRMESHAALPPDERYVRVYRYLAVANPSERFRPFTVGSAYDTFANEVTIDDVQSDINASIDMKEQFRANDKMVMTRLVDNILEEQSIDRRLWTRPPNTMVDKSSLHRFYSYVPTQPLVNRISNMLLESCSITLDLMCTAKGLQFEAFRSLVEIVRREVLTVVSGDVPHYINVSCNVLYLETVLSRRDCVFLPLPKVRHSHADVTFLNDSSPNAATILREIDQLEDTTAMCERLTLRLNENAIGLVVAVELAIQLHLNNLKRLFQSGWIEYNGKHYHMVYETVWNNASYKKSCPMTVKRLAKHVRVLQNNVWIKEHSEDVHEQLVLNYNRVRQEFEERGHHIYAFYVLSDRLMRLRDTSQDAPSNRRLNNRGRVISYYQDNVDIKIVFLKLMYLELTFEDVVDLASRLPPVTVTRSLIDANPIAIDGEMDIDASVEQFLDYPFHAHVTYHVLSLTRNDMIRLVHEVCRRYNLYVIVM